jgi:hypothetical protein
MSAMTEAQDKALSLADTLRIRPHYLAHIYAAVKDALATYPETDHSCGKAQLEEIRDKAERDWRASR